MNKPEGYSDRFISAAVAQTHTPDESPIISALRPAPGHPFASLSVCDQERGGQPEVSTAHYFLLGNRLRYPPSTVAEGLEQTGVDLHEAFVDWTAVGLWLERLVNDGHATSHLLDTVRPLVMQARTQQQRLWSLLLSVQEEHARLTQQDAAREKEGRS